MPKDLRTYLQNLEEAGEVLHVTKEVDPRDGVGGLAWQGENRLRKATSFHNLKGYPGWRAVSYVCGSRSRLAIALGTTPERFISDVLKRIEKGLIKCQMVSQGPVMERSFLGEEVDLNQIPIHRMSNLDAGPYIGSSMDIVKDPDTGIRNVSLHRHQLKGRNRLGIHIHGGRHLDMVYQKYRARNEAMPVAIAIGHHGAYYIAACWTTAFGVDELEIAGALMGEAVPLVKCQTIDLEAPANAEIVIEGEIPPHEREEEGPFAEHTGYARAGSGLNPVVNVKAITMRHDAIYYALQGGRPISESQILDGMPMEVGLFERLRDVNGFVDLKDVVAVPYAGGSHIIVIQMTPRVEGEVKNVLLATLSSQYVHPKIAIAVDDDVDPHDPTQVLWSISTRVNPGRDIFMIPNTLGHHLDPSGVLITAPGVFPQYRLNTKMGIDATKPPLRVPEERDYFTLSVPTGADRLRIEDFF
ncbi:MAG: UbiD family decarboxylase [Chloroflexi bacterium]|nr:UbiD family decarboxylase [Chloroflexota bacterium]